MEELNRSLFLLLNAPAHPAALAVFFARFFAQYAVALVPLTLVWGWLRGSEPTRKILLEAALCAITALLLNQVIGSLWPHPRPFMIGLGHTLISHAPDSSFPSDHLTLLWSVAFSLLAHAALRRWGLALALLGLPMAWARIYLGVHFPLDMLGAALVSWLCAWLCAWLAQHQAERFMQPLYGAVATLYQRLFAPFIRLGWVRK